MHGWRSLRRASLLLCGLLAAGSSPPADAADDGWIRLDSAVGGDTTSVWYTWQQQGLVHRGATTWIELRDADGWRRIATIPLGQGGAWCERKVCASQWTWPSASMQEGRYLLRFVIAEPLFPSSAPTRFWIDHTAPAVRIETAAPARDLEPVDGVRVIRAEGPTTFRPVVRDAPTGAFVTIRGRRHAMDGLGHWRWTFRNEVTGETWRYEPFDPDAFPSPRFDFDAHPGIYAVTFEIRDAAWNLGSSTVRVLGTASTPHTPTAPVPRPCPPEPLPC